MSTLPKEVLREIIKDGKLKTVGDLHSYIKDKFKYALKEKLEAVRCRTRIWKESKLQTLPTFVNGNLKVVLPANGLILH